MEDAFRLLVESREDEGLFLLSPAGEILTWNAGAAALTGWTPAEAVGRRITLLNPAEGGTATLDLMVARVQGRHAGEGLRRRKDGATFLAFVSLQALRDPAGALLGFACCLRDCTPSRAAEDALRREAERLTAIVAAALDSLLLLDLEGTVIFANAAAERTFGTETPLLGRSCSDPTWVIATPDGGVAPNQVFAWTRVRRTGEPAAAEWTLLGADGARLTLSVHATPLYLSAELVGVVVAARDVTAPARAAEETARRERLHALSLRLVEVQEAERRAIARELHDEVGQNLTALRILLGASPEAAGEPLAQACELADTLLTRVQELALDLRPAMLDDLGLLPALLWLADRCAAQTGVCVEVEHTGLNHRFPQELETAAYRIVQEALTNAVRYAGVERVEVRAWADRETLGVQVADTGRGFDSLAASPPDGRRTGGSGLAGMRDRAMLLGGRVTLESAPGKGTRITAELPLALEIS